MSKVYELKLLYNVGSVFKVVFSEKVLEFQSYFENATFFITFFEKVGADYEQLLSVFFHVFSDKKVI